MPGRTYEIFYVAMGRATAAGQVRESALRDRS